VLVGHERLKAAKEENCESGPGAEVNNRVVCLMGWRANAGALKRLIVGKVWEGEDTGGADPGYHETARDQAGLASKARPDTPALGLG
jgi:hypothetical protein